MIYHTFKSLKYLKGMILYSKKIGKHLKMALNCPKWCKSFVSANDAQTLPSHWPNKTLYRIDECMVYAVIDMVWYHPGWMAPLMFASNLLKHIIKSCPRIQLFFFQETNGQVLSHHLPGGATWEVRAWISDKSPALLLCLKWRVYPQHNE